LAATRIAYTSMADLDRGGHGAGLKPHQHPNIPNFDFTKIPGYPYYDT
jgi:hypothetical protein